MKRIFAIAIITIFHCLSMPAFAQDGFTNKEEAKNEYKDSLKEGKWMEYQDSDHLNTSKDSAVYYRLAIYTKGKVNGIARVYSISDDKLFIQAPYSNGKRNGVVRSFYESGKTKWETNFINDTIIGVQKEYYENGAIESAYPHVNGQRNDTSKTFYPTGELDWQAYYINDTIIGSQKEYYQSGKTKWDSPFMNGKKNGTQYEYYENGKPEIEVSYTDGKKTGIGKIYYDDGEIKWETPFVNDLKNGVEKGYYPTVNTTSQYKSSGLEWEITYTNGIKNGPQTQYDRQGQVLSTTQFVNGKAVANPN